MSARIGNHQELPVYFFRDESAGGPSVPRDQYEVIDTQRCRTLKALKADSRMLGRQGEIAPLFAGVPCYPQRGEKRVAALTLNAMDKTAGRADDNPKNDQHHHRVDVLSDICAKQKFLANPTLPQSAAAVYLQETIPSTAAAFTKDGYQITGDYAAHNGGEFSLGRGLRYFTVCGYGPAFKSDAEILDSALERVVHPRGRPWQFMFNWTGQTSCFDKTHYTIVKDFFIPYAVQNQAALCELVHALGVAMGLRRKTDPSEGGFGAVVNSLSGISRFDGMLVTCTYEKQLQRTVWHVQTHLASFHEGKRFGQRREIQDFVDMLAKKRPLDFIVVAGDWNRPQSAERETQPNHASPDCGDFFGEMAGDVGLGNPHFAQGRCISMPRAQVRESFLNESSLDCVYMVRPADLNLVRAAGKFSIPAREPGETQCVINRDGLFNQLRAALGYPAFKTEPRGRFTLEEIEAQTGRNDVVAQSLVGRPKEGPLDRRLTDHCAVALNAVFAPQASMPSVSQDPLSSHQARAIVVSTIEELMTVITQRMTQNAAPPWADCLPAQP